MTDYKKKKKLIDDNKDIYISDYDKELSYDALSKIVDAKKDYANAAKSGDKEGMTRANELANAIRAKYGSYTGGEFGNEYNPFDYGEDDYSSGYDDEMERLYRAISDGPSEFYYDYTKDPAYLAYREVYEREGNLAYQRALAKNSLKTGGKENSNAQSAATQAMAYYNSLLASKVPELYEAAYSRHYKDEEKRLDMIEKAYDILSESEERDYKRHTDRLDRLDKLSEFEYQKSKDNSDRQWDITKAMTESGERRGDLLYDILRDSIDDEKWSKTHRLNSYKAKNPYYASSGTLGSILDYARSLFGREDLSSEDLYRLLGL